MAPDYDNPEDGRVETSIPGGRETVTKAAGGFQSLIDMPWIKERHRPAGYPERLLSLLPGLQPPYVLDSWQPVRQPRERAAIGEGLVAPVAWPGWVAGTREVELIPEGT